MTLFYCPWQFFSLVLVIPNVSHYMSCCIYYGPDFSFVGHFSVQLLC